MAMIRLRKLTKRYKQLTALVDVDLRIETGELFGLVGTNGAGRTTLLNIVATLVRATAGYAEIAGLDVGQRPLEVRRCIGYVPESPGFYDDLQIGEYLDLIAAAHHLEPPAKTKAIDLALTRCRLDPRRLIGLLSKGCQQQLALAAALLHDPTVLLLDEPTTHLDPLARQRLHTLLQELHSRGTTILLACNTAPDLQRLCNRIGFLHQGRVLDIRPTTGEQIDSAAVLQALVDSHPSAGTSEPSASGDAT